MLRNLGSENPCPVPSGSVRDRRAGGPRRHQHRPPLRPPPPKRTRWSRWMDSLPAGAQPGGGAPSVNPVVLLPALGAPKRGVLGPSGWDPRVAARHRPHRPRASSTAPDHGRPPKPGPHNHRPRHPRRLRNRPPPVLPRVRGEHRSAPGRAAARTQGRPATETVASRGRRSGSEAPSQRRSFAPTPRAAEPSGLPPVRGECVIATQGDVGLLVGRTRIFPATGDR